MSELKVYLYANCSTCKRARQYLRARNISFTEIPIREQPPTVTELRRMLTAYGGEIRKLFNSSGQDYRAGGYKDRLNELSVDQALAELAANGNLIKRPFVISDNIQLVGFTPDQWDEWF